MSRRRVYSVDTLSIMERFYAALDAAREHKFISDVAAFCDDNYIDKRHLYAQRKDLGRGFFEVGWLVPLVEQFGISSNWLITGKGTMFLE